MCSGSTPESRSKWCVGRRDENRVRSKYDGYKAMRGLAGEGVLSQSN